MTLQILNTVLIVTAMNTILALVLVIAERFLANYGSCRIVINKEKELDVQGGSSLLSSLAGQKIFLPSACGGRGTCAYCKCKIKSGAGPVLPTEQALLTSEETDQQIRLACQVKVKEDLEIEIPEDLFRIQEFRAEVAVLKDLTHDIKLLRLKLIQPKTIRFKSGQYIQLQTKPYDGVKETAQRAYSMASPNYEKQSVDLIIRLVPDGICTTWVHQFLKMGETVTFIGPMGDFYLREGEGEIVMVAGGSGMAPMVSILMEMARNKNTRKITYLFGSVSKKDLFYVDEMRSLEKQLGNFTFIPVLSQPDPADEWKGETGLITVPLAAYLKKINIEAAQGYLCGSPGMVNACVKVMKENGLTHDRIFYDPFA